MAVRTDGIWCKDAAGRTLLLRGVNLGGSTKVPTQPDGATYRSEGFFDHRSVSFVGRPFPLAEADEHFRRLRSWGLTFLRLLTTWEAVEHAGPGQYDEEYLQYLRQIVQKAAEYEITVFIDPHQDVWSRWTGGDGAPGWTLEAAGFDLKQLAVTGSAIPHQTHGDPFPRMIWPTNYTKLGCATMFTLFFAGNDFAPATMVEGVPIQEYLQSHYIKAMLKIAERLRDLPNVVGFDTLNEPGSGWVGCADLGELQRGLLLAGASPSPWQSLLLGAGHTQEVGVWELDASGPQHIGTTTLNPDGVVVWQPEGGCLWQQNGVWSIVDGVPHLDRPDHFAQVNGRPVHFVADYLKPFMIRFAQAIRTVMPDALIFLEGVPGGDHPHWEASDPANVINAGHWYDVLTLFTKHYDPALTVNLGAGASEKIVGREAVRQAFVDQLASVKQIASVQMGGIPTLIGEFGLPYDLDHKAAYKSGDWQTHTEALDAYFNAMDANLLHATIWNYTADNTNAHGDLWNDEDLSIFSRDQQNDPQDINSGGRAIGAVVRPYAQAVAGEPLAMRFDLGSRVFEFRFQPDPAISAPTEIFVPVLHYPAGYEVELTSGQAEQEHQHQRLLITATTSEPITVRIKPR